MKVNQIKHQLEDLTPAELILLQQHIKLGEKHLKQLLNAQELQTLFLLGEHVKEGSKKLPRDPREVTGNVTLILNTIFTAIFGAWMGFSGFWNLGLKSKFAFFSISILALLVGVTVGYQTVKMVRAHARADIHTQQLHQLQTLLLEKIRQKREEEEKELKSEISKFLATFGGKVSFVAQTEVSALLQQKIASYPPSSAIRVYTSELNKLGKEVVKEWTEIFHGSEIESIHPDREEEKPRVLNSMIRKLIEEPARNPITPRSWISEHFRELITSLIPTMLGGFSSLFVYLGGAPEILKTLGYHALFVEITSPFAKSIQFALMLLMTGMLAASSFHNNRNAFRRRQELEKTEKKIIEMQGFLTLIDAKLQKLSALKGTLEKIVAIYAIVDELNK